jgi:LemA protein
MNMTLVIVLIIIVGLVGWVIAMYNGLIAMRNRVEEAWSDIDVQLKRRYDLIPNLVSTVKGYASHEKETLQNVTEARSQAMQAESPHDKAQAENFLSDTLKSLFAVSEAYPDLKANENFLELQRELTDTENKVQASRRFYNGNVRDYNTKIETVPTNIVANTFNFEQREFFELAEDEQDAKDPVKVEF